MSFVRIPPDSTGKRIQHSTTILVEYVQGSKNLAVGDPILGDSSEVEGEVGRLLQGSNQQEGTFYMTVSIGSEDRLQVGETLLIRGEPFAEVASSQNIYAQNVQIAGGTNTTNKVNVDSRGAIFTRTADGAQQFDAIGKLEVAQSTTIGEYSFSYDRLDENFQYKTENSGTITHRPESHSLIYSCGTSEDALAQGTTHLYHTYQASIAHRIGMSVGIGDQGKENVVRRWGYFNDKDGLFFELNGTTLNVVVRSSASGNVKEIRTPQSEWNIDRVNGTRRSLNLSRLDIDPTNLYLWWIDFHWYGAGVVRFGIRDGGERITFHQTVTEDRGPLPFMRQGNLPLRFEQFNDGVVGSTSEMRVVEATVNAMGNFTPKYQTGVVDAELPPTEINSHEFKPLFSGRLKEFFKNQENRSIVLPTDLTSYVAGDTAVELKIIKNATLTNDTWTIDAGPESAVEVDGTATEISGGRAIWKTILGANTLNRNPLTDVFNLEQGETVKRHANLSDYDVFTLLGRLVKDGGNPVDLSVTLQWKELQ